MDKIILIKNVPGVPKDYPTLPFGRQIEHRRKLEEFKTSPETKSIHLSQKRKSYRMAVQEFVAIYAPVAYYAPGFYSNKFTFDDSFEVFYQK